MTRTHVYKYIIHEIFQRERTQQISTHNRYKTVREFPISAERKYRDISIRRKYRRSASTAAKCRKHPSIGPSVYPPSAAACSRIRNIRRIPSTGRLALQFRRRACVVILFTIADCNKIYMHRRWIYMRRQLNSCASRAAHAIYIRHTGGEGGSPEFYAARSVHTCFISRPVPSHARPFLANRPLANRRVL